MSVPGATTNDFVVTYRVAQSFSYEGRHLAKGEVLSGHDPIALAVNKTHPGLLLVSVRKKEPLKYA